MEVQRNTPIHFGHFRPVETKATKSFALLLNDTANNPYKAEKGLEQFIKKRSKENNYDVAYIKNKNNEYVFAVINNRTEKIAAQYPTNAKCPSRFERATKFLTSTINEIQERKNKGNISRKEIIKESAKAAWRFTLRVIKGEFDRTEVLPSGMRAAGYKAAHLETFLK